MLHKNNHLRSWQRYKSRESSSKNHQVPELCLVGRLTALNQIFPPGHLHFLLKANQLSAWQLVSPNRKENNYENQLTSESWKSSRAFRFPDPWWFLQEFVLYIYYIYTILLYITVYYYYTILYLFYLQELFEHIQ